MSFRPLATLGTLGYQRRREFLNYKLLQCRLRYWAVRGTYRKKGKQLTSAHVKPNPKLRLQTGSKGILKLGGVGGGRVLVWETINGSSGGKMAADMYTNVILPALKAAYPAAKKFTLLEDNDPVGNRSKAGMIAKKDGKMDVLEIPKRSPDLNVLDFAIWKEVEKRMRKAERAMGDNRHETRAQFEQRLNRVALGLEKDFIDKCIGNLQVRVQRLHKAKGGLFEEGGRSKRSS